MKNKLNIAAIILARGGSKGLKKKNIRPLLGKPLIAYTIEYARRSKYVNKIFVCTEDTEIAKIAKQYNTEVIPEPVELAQDNAPVEPVLKYVLDYIKQNKNYVVDIVVYLQITDIFRKEGGLDECVQKLLDNPKLDTAFVGYPTYKNFWHKVNGKFERLSTRGFNPDGSYIPRQLREPIYREDTGLACATRASVIQKGRRIGDNVEIIPNDDDASSIDVHDDFDLWLAEQVLKYKQDKK